jgi:ATP-binding cassette subfamily F protein 3
MLDPELTIFDTIDKVAVGEIRTKIRALLGGFLFGEDEIDKKVKILSGGEKARLALAKLLLTPANLLVLDEPTNHLDMQSKDILKNALIQYQGTLIVVSHDRDFLQGLTNKVYEFRERRIREYIGDIYDFLESRSLRSFRELEKKNLKDTYSGTQVMNSSDNKQLYEKRKQLDRDIRKLTGQIQKTEDEIHTLEDTMKKLSELLANPSNIGDKTLFNTSLHKYAAGKKELDRMINQWEKLILALDELRGQRSDL